MKTWQPIISVSRRCPWCLWQGALGTPDRGFRNCYNTSLPFLRGAWVCISNFHVVYFQCLRWEQLSSKVGFPAFLYILRASFVCICKLLLYNSVIKPEFRLHYISKITRLVLLRQIATQVPVSADKHHSDETDLPSSPKVVLSCSSWLLSFRHPVCKALKWSELLSQLGPAISSFSKKVWNMEWFHFAELTMRISAGRKTFRVSGSQGAVCAGSRASNTMRQQCRMRLSFREIHFLFVRQLYVYVGA